MLRYGTAIRASIFASSHPLNLSMAPKECYDGADVVLRNQKFADSPVRLASLLVLYLDQRRKLKGALHRFGRSLGLDAIIVVRSRPKTTLGRTLFEAAA